MTNTTNRVPPAVLILILACVVLLTAACSKTVVRENILSSVESGIGITVVQNKQTQMYEVKAGYIRSQFYSIPTGKVVENDPSVFCDMSTCRRLAVMASNAVEPNRTKIFSLLSSCVREKKSQTSNAANITPELVSGIRAHTGWDSLLLGMDVSESFAVGKEAVKSNAAVAMYISQADSDEKAKSASDAINSFKYDNDPSVKCLNIWLKDKKNVKTLNDWWKQNSHKGIGIIGIKSKENRSEREKFLEEHPEITCD